MASRGKNYQFILLGRVRGRPWDPMVRAIRLSIEAVDRRLEEPRQPTKAWEVTTQRHDEIEAEGRGVVLPASPLAGIELTAMSDTIRALVEGVIRPAGADAVVRALAALRLAMELNVHGAALPAALSYEA